MEQRHTIGGHRRDTVMVNDQCMHVVKLLFYQYSDMSLEHGEHGQGNGWNWLAACWTGGGCNVTHERMTEKDMWDASVRGDPVPEPIFTHVELRFSDGYGTSITSRSDCVHYERRLHSAQNYSFVVEYLVEPQCEEAMQRVAKSMHDRRVGFNRMGFITNFLPVVGSVLAGRARDDSVFCSEYIVQLMHHANQMLDIDPHQTSPQQLYHYTLDDIRDGRATRSWNRERGHAIRQEMRESSSRKPPRRSMIRSNRVDKKK